MYSTSEKEKEFLEKSKSLTSESVKELTDRELQEKQVVHLMNIERSNERIKANMQFWFYFGLGIFVLSILYNLK